MMTSLLTQKRWAGALVFSSCLALGALTQVGAQTEQTVDVTIKGFTFVTKQAPLQLNVPTVIVIRNEDNVRHDFGSAMFQRSLARAESGGIIAYGKGLEGVYLDPKREVRISFTLERPGRYEFRCSIHPDMKGEILLINVGSA